MGCSVCNSILCTYCIEDCSGCGMEACSKCYMGHQISCVSCTKRLCPEEVTKEKLCPYCEYTRAGGIQ